MSAHEAAVGLTIGNTELAIEIEEALQGVVARVVRVGETLEEYDREAGLHLKLRHLPGVRFRDAEIFRAAVVRRLLHLILGGRYANPDLSAGSIDPAVPLNMIYAEDLVCIMKAGEALLEQIKQHGQYQGRVS